MSAQAPLNAKANSLLGLLPGELLAQVTAGEHGLTAHLFRHRSVEAPVFVPAVAEPLLVWIAAGSACVEERAGDGEWVSVDVNVGDLFIVDSDEPYTMRWTARTDSFQALHVYLSVPLIEAAATAIFGWRQKPALREVSGERDASVSALLGLIHHEMICANSPTGLLLEALGQALAICVLRGFADSRCHVRRRSALPAARLRAAIQHMHDHLADPFSLAALASIAGLSLFHFSRMFKLSTGQSPQRYFIGMRVAQARLLLCATGTPVIEVGMAVGYASPGHFSQVFRRATGLTPTEFRGSNDARA